MLLLVTFAFAVLSSSSSLDSSSLDSSSLDEDLIFTQRPLVNQMFTKQRCACNTLWCVILTVMPVTKMMCRGDRLKSRQFHASKETSYSEHYVGGFDRGVRSPGQGVNWPPTIWDWGQKIDTSLMSNRWWFLTLTLLLKNGSSAPRFWSTAASHFSQCVVHVIEWQWQVCASIRGQKLRGGRATKWSLWISPSGVKH